eukprot:Skav210502  [mRNA]  locus=scaffold601:379678:380935:+ [translate_table: standard]
MYAYLCVVPDLVNPTKLAAAAGSNENGRGAPLDDRWCFAHRLIGAHVPGGAAGMDAWYEREEAALLWAKLRVSRRFSQANRLATPRAEVAASFAAVNTAAVIVLASHLWWASGSGYQKYVDILALKQRRILTKRC